MFDKSKLWWVALFMIGLTILTTLISIILSIGNHLETLQVSEIGSIGDFISGITAPVIGLVGAVLVYMAFHEQVKANSLIQAQIVFQNVTAEINAIELKVGKFQEALDNVSIALKHIKITEDTFFPIEKRDIVEVEYILQNISKQCTMASKSGDYRNYLLGRLDLLFRLYFKTNAEEFFAIFTILDQKYSHLKYSPGVTLAVNSSIFSYNEICDTLGIGSKRAYIFFKNDNEWYVAD